MFQSNNVNNYFCKDKDIDSNTYLTYDHIDPLTYYEITPLISDLSLPCVHQMFEIKI